MELHMKIAFIFFNGLLFLNFVICERPLNGQEELRWVCNCAANPLSVFNSFNTYDCSTSCHCVPGKIGVADGVRWSCSCAPLATQVTENIHRSSCFASCNCSFGSRGTSAYQKQITSKDIIAILLACVVFISICLVVSIAFHFYRKEKPYLQRRIYSSARDTSSNSSANLISYRSASFLRFQHKTDSLNPLTEFFRRITFIFKGDKQIVHGSTIQFSFSELEQATDRFSSANLIGQGVSSNVFRGKLFDGKIVAIKKLKLKVFSEEEADSVFLTEIELISRLNHCHVVPILGYCTEYQSRNYERLLVFEYMPNGNLRECLDAKHGKEPLSWATRVRIALGAARGLEYLHEASAPRILHRDIKSTNILLDENYKPKITDLGMAKCLMAEDYPSCSSSPAQMLGTFGYFAPEYAIVGKASLKSDVFSYGVVILELITGRPPIQKSSKGDESLVIWCTPRLNDSSLVVAELPDPLLKGNFPEEEMQIMAHLARECLQWDPESRPTMSEIVQILTSIAPEKNQRRNFHENFHRGLSWRSIRGVSASDKPPYCSNISSEEEGNSGRSQDESSLFEQNGRLSERVHVNQGRRDFVLSAEYMQELALLASTIQRRRCSEEVDLTEPRFESFI